MQPVLVAALLASTAMGAATLQELSRCGTTGITNAQRTYHKAAASAEAAVASAGLITRAELVINIYIHIVASTDAKANAITDKTVEDQMSVLNDNYAPSGISFRLQETTRTANSNWAVDGNPRAMKKALRSGQYIDLNLYFLEEVGTNYGYCTLPKDNVVAGDGIWTVDGCTIRADTMPGNAPPYGEGKTATHEVGHWFGLFHTFEDGCSGGDEVADTPAQATATRGCPVGKDTCPSLEGLDPIHNYMDYSDDSCYEEFTNGQQERMHSMFNMLRKGV